MHCALINYTLKARIHGRIGEEIVVGDTLICNDDPLIA